MTKESLRIMAFGAHPPDIVSRAGGTLAKHAQRGDAVMAVSLTDGVRHMNPSLARFAVVGPEAVSEVGRIKRAEMERACEILGVQHVRFLGLRDSPLSVNQSSLQAMSDVMREFRPDVILTHHPQETSLTGHPDHGDAGDAVLRAFMLAMELGFESRYLPIVANSVYFYTVTLNVDGPALGHIAGPSVYVDISDVIETKMKATLALGGTMPYSEDRVAAMVAQSKGREQLVGVDHAEGYSALHTPVVDYFDRRAKGRWLDSPQPAAWQSLSLWPSSEGR